MHELSLAETLVEEVEKVVIRENAAYAVRVAITIGALSGVERGPFEFCWPLVTEGSRARGARLEIREAPAVARCRSCGAESEIEMPQMSCGRCRSSDVELTGGTEFKIDEIEVEV